MSFARFPARKKMRVCPHVWDGQREIKFIQFRSGIMVSCGRFVEDHAPYLADFIVCTIQEATERLPELSDLMPDYGTDVIMDDDGTWQMLAPSYEEDPTYNDAAETD